DFAQHGMSRMHHELLTLNVQLDKTSTKQLRVARCQVMSAQRPR
ncbi:MAG: hypothetical protein K0Q78_1821, partial [Cellvibrio sp.]|nr:hypothetical protein [Cellvibrio sp.]